MPGRGPLAGGPFSGAPVALRQPDLGKLLGGVHCCGHKGASLVSHPREAASGTDERFALDQSECVLQQPGNLVAGEHVTVVN